MVHELEDAIGDCEIGGMRKAILCAPGYLDSSTSVGSSSRSLSLCGVSRLSHMDVELSHLLSSRF